MASNPLPKMNAHTADCPAQATPFTKVLIANRGEIALRVLRSARAAGYRTVAVFSTADAAAAHVMAADEAVCIGEPLPAQSYLNIPAIIDAARRTGADAVHPGYGFLAENAGFAQACRDAGLVFIGPSPEAILAMGHKAGAKRLMAEAGVPVVPGYMGDDQSAECLATESGRIGYPVMIKAVAGGGGRGMRLVAAAADFADALRSAQSEAANAFGDATVILERAVLAPRHIEIQIMADRFGHAIHLGERDCSVQRRHQKLIEEAPSPAVGPELRAAMGATAVAAVQAIGYEGAGTLEFLLDQSGHYYFMEMNTRLQVEHPVTEAITGLDLVALQLQVAAGEPLGITQDQVRFAGHAIEVRLCAEDVPQGFMPQSGRLARWQLPQHEPLQGPERLRVEHALADGAEVPPYYDSMVAKFIAHGASRDEARRRLISGLADTVALGLKTNQAFLARCLAHPVFAAGGATTAFIGTHQAELLATDEARQQQAAALAAVLLLETAPDAGASVPHRLPHQLPLLQRFELDGRIVQASLLPERTRVYQVVCTGLPPATVGGGAASDHGAASAATSPVATSSAATSRAVSSPAATLQHTLAVLRLDQGLLRYTLDGVMASASWVRDGDRLLLSLAGQAFEVRDTTRAASARQQGSAASDGKLRAAMNGRVVALQAEVGQRVAVGQPILTLEAMKMEHVHSAPVAGVLTALHVAVGEQVPARRVVAEISPDAADAGGAAAPG